MANLPVLEQALFYSRKIGGGKYYQYFSISMLEHAATIAKRFVFNKDASAYLGTFIKDCEDIIIDNRQFAIPPYETCYFEFDLQAMLDALGRRTVVVDRNSPDLDKNIGLLVHKNQLFCCSNTLDQKEAIFEPFSYSLFTPSNGEFEQQFTWSRNKFNIMTLLFGSSADIIKNKQNLIDQIASEHKINFNFPNVKENISFDIAQKCTGTFRTYLAIALLLNQQKFVEYSFVPPKAVVWKGKRRVFAAHSVVKFNLERSKSFRKVFVHGLRGTPRRHEVKGHFAHKNLIIGCTHFWVADNETTTHWNCTHCKGLRYWVRSHERGDATEGYRTKHYEVIASKE